MPVLPTYVERAARGIWGSMLYGVQANGSREP